MTSKLFIAAAACGLLFSNVARAQEVDGPPRPPLNASPGRTLPLRDHAGIYSTPNHGLSPVARAWHVRAALNVAALACRDAAREATVAAYNAMLTDHRAVLAADNLALIGEYRAHYGPAWQARYDADMTRLYSFFAEPAAYRAFCAAAREVLASSASVPDAAFNDFAAAELDRLEAPITDFYAAYDNYLTSLAAWRASRPPVGEAPAPVLATTAPAPVSVAVPEEPPVDDMAGPMPEAPSPAMMPPPEVAPRWVRRMPRRAWDGPPTGYAPAWPAYAPAREPAMAPPPNMSAPPEPAPVAPPPVAAPEPAPVLAAPPAPVGPPPLDAAPREIAAPVAPAVAPGDFLDAPTSADDAADPVDGAPRLRSHT